MKTDRNGIIIVTAIVNWMFRFGDYGPKVSEDPSLKPIVENTLKNVRHALTDEGQTVELTAAVIISAAAQNVPMTVFQSHFDKLHELGLVMKKINIMGLRKS